MSTRRKTQRKTKKERPVSEQSMMSPQQPERPGDQDIIATLMEEIQALTDQRLFFKSQVRSMQRRAEVAEMAQASLQARIDQLEAQYADAEQEEEVLLVQEDDAVNPEPTQPVE